MAGGIFISYRRDDAKHAAGRLVDRLVTAVGRDKLFMDVDNIEPGLDFVKVLNDQVARCDCLLALIGPQWLDARNAKGQRRLDDPNDFVRIEIEAALARDIRVVPVLLDGAEMPLPEVLPLSLQSLPRRQAVRISHERFAAEAETLASSLKTALGIAGKKGWFSNPAGSSVPKPAHVTEPHKPKAAAAIASSLPAEQGPVPGKGPLIAAWIFALGAVPTAFGLALQGGNGVSAIAGVTSATALVFGLVSLIALLIRRATATAREASLWWCGFALAFGFALGPFLWYNRLDVFGLAGGQIGGPLMSGWVLGAIFATLSTFAFHRWWSKRQRNST